MADDIERLNAALEGRYRIERELGAGGMATVFLARDVRHDRLVALKVLRPELTEVVGADRFIQEIRTTAALQHPHILPLFDSGTAGGSLFYVMPYVAGETLRARIARETQLGIEESVRIASDVADALDYAHRQGIVHRDIKPENILLHDGRPMVADFGIALAVSAAGGRMTKTGTSVGTPHYMSPEQATADRNITGRSDMYSLASVLFEMLTGEPPHTGPSAQAVVLKIIAESARPVTDLRKSVPPNVAAAVSKGLEKLPADRFDSAAAFAAALADPSWRPTKSEVVEPARPRSGSLPALVFQLVLLAAAFAGGRWLGAGSTRDTAVVRASINLAAGDDLDGTRRGEACCNQGRPSLPVLAFSRDGTTLVYAGQRGGERQLFRRAIGERESVPVPGTEGAESPVLSPDGTQIAFWSDGWIRRVPLDGGQTVQIAPVVTPFGMSWGDDGNIVFRDGNIAGLRRVPAAGGDVEAVPSSLDARLPQVLPGSRVALYTSSSGSDAADLIIESVRFRDGARDTVLRDAADARYVDTGHLVFARDTGIMAIRFDPETLRVSGSVTGVLPDVMRAFGGTHPDVRTDAAQFAVSPAGHLAFITGGSTRPYDRRVAWLNRQGETAELDYPGRSYISARVSPDGRGLAMSAPAGPDAGLWVVDRERSGVRRRLVEGSVTFFAWSPDGTRIAFSRFDGIATIPVQGGSSPVVVMPTATPAERINVAAWLGDDILFVAADSTHHLTLQAFSVSSRDRRTILREDDGDIAYPAISPDGRHIAYAFNRNNQAELVLRSWPSLESRFVIATGSIFGIAWARRGRDLLYTDFYDALSNRLMIVEMPDGSGLSAGAPRELFISRISRAWPIRAWDVTRDEDRFLTLRTEDSTDPPEPEIHLVLNWFRELRELR